jgi:hypothetical protein
MADPDLRPLTRDDLQWVLDLIDSRRDLLMEFAPRFWRRSINAREVHGSFLGSQIDNPDIVTVRTDHGFVFAGRQAELIMVDDMAVDDDAAWPVDGVRLLQAVAATDPGRHDLRVVCPVPEPARRVAVASLGLTVAESWWHRELPTDPQAWMWPAVPDDSPEVTVTGAAGRLVPAPPVYDPGGPVLIVGELSGADSLADLERAAGQAGAVVAVVPQSAKDTDRADWLQAAGYLRTTDFYQGLPAAF